MKVIDRYIAKQFLLFFVSIILSLLACFIIIDFFGKIRMFFSNNATFFQISRYFLNMIPFIFSQMAPISLLLATLITFGNMSRHNEILALKASGISVYRAALPLVVIAAALTPLLFAFNEYVTPAAQTRAERILSVEIKKQKVLGSFKQNQSWYRGAKGIYSFKMADSETASLRGVTFHFLDNNFNITSRIDADLARWENGHWRLINADCVTFSTTSNFTLQHFPTLRLDIPEKPKDFLAIQKSPDRMGFSELYRYVKKLDSEGYSTNRYRTDLYAKIAFSFVGLLLVPIGIAFGVRAERSGGIAQGITLGTFIGFSYWLVFAFSLSLGRADTLPAGIAAWGADVLFALLALLLSRSIRT